MSEKFIVVNNIPTPYRIHLFDLMSTEFESRGIDFEAWFMSNTERGRYWTFDPSDWRFKSKTFSGIHPRLLGTTLHFNPSMMLDLRKSRPRWVLLGGAWLTPSNLGLIATSPSATSLLLWSEANVRSSQHHGGLIGSLRKLVYSRVDACVIPGQIARDTVTEAWGIKNPTFLNLPNIVDDAKFAKGVQSAKEMRREMRSTLGIDDDDTVLILPARLIESYKGVLNFLKAVESISDRLPVVIVAGDGEDRLTIESWAKQSSLPTRVLGQVSEEKLIELYAASDALVLPSFRDPNPLTLIEGLWAGLPLIVSSGCGNWPEVLRENKNGWLVDPYQRASIQSAVSKLMQSSKEERQAMGYQSLKVAQERFSSHAVVKSFVDQLLEVKI